MKKTVAVICAFVLVGCVAFAFGGCGMKDDEVTTTLPSDTSVRATDNMDQSDRADINDGKITDVSGDNDNGVLGEIVTDVSEGVSSVVTDISEDAAQMRD